MCPVLSDRKGGKEECLTERGLCALRGRVSNGDASDDGDGAKERRANPWVRGASRYKAKESFPDSIVA